MPRFQRPYRIPRAYEDEVNRQVDEMLKNGIIRPPASPWNAPVILVKKRSGTLRFVSDFPYLNDVTKRDTYLLPKIQDIVDKTSGSMYWSTLDAVSAYWSIPLSEDDKEKTAFTVPQWKYEFNVTAFRLRNAGASYQRMIDICLSGLPSNRTLAYMDDIITCNASFEEHLLSLTSVFDKLREAGIQLKVSKCIFACEGIKPQERLISSVKQFKRPESKRELKGFLGLAGFHRNFIANFADLSHSLNKLTNDNVAFIWNETCEMSFLRLKELLAFYPVLAFPKLGEPFIVEVDASDHSVGSTEKLVCTQ